MLLGKEQVATESPSGNGICSPFAPLLGWTGGAGWLSSRAGSQIMWLSMQMLAHREDRPAWAHV